MITGSRTCAQHAVIDLGVIVGAAAEFCQCARGHQDDAAAGFFDRRDLLLIGADHVVEALGVLHREMVGAGAGKHQRATPRLCRPHRTLDQFQRGRPVQPHAALRGVHRLGDAKAEVPDVLAKRNGAVPVDRRGQPRIALGQRIGHRVGGRERDAVQRAFELGRKRPRRRQAVGLDAALRRSAASGTTTIAASRACSWLCPHTLIGATSIQRRSRQLCSAHSASCTPLAPSSSVYLYGASSQTWRMNISHCSLKPLS